MTEENPEQPSNPEESSASGATPDSEDGAHQTEGETPATAQPAEPPLTINGQYIKDLSFEAPTTPGIFALMREQEPSINVNIDVNAQPMQEDVYEVILHVKAECRVGETAAFIVELAYGGLFTIKVAPEHIQPILLIECPRLLFPYVRYIISDATRDGGFPPLLLGPVDFVAMYQNQLAQQQQAAEKAADNEPETSS